MRKISADPKCIRLVENRGQVFGRQILNCNRENIEVYEINLTIKNLDSEQIRYHFRMLDQYKFTDDSMPRHSTVWATKKNSKPHIVSSYNVRPAGLIFHGQFRPTLNSDYKVEKIVGNDHPLKVKSRYSFDLLLKPTSFIDRHNYENRRMQ